MQWMRILFSRCAAFFRRGRLDREFEEELRAHIDLATAENCARGMSPGEARSAALRSFGGLTPIREDYRARRGLPWLDQAARDVRLALRGLRKSPGFTLTALLTLAFGIGAVTSVFSVVDAVLLKPFAFPDPQRLLVLREAVDDSSAGHAAIPVNYRHFLRIKQQSHAIEDAAIFHQRGVSVFAEGEHPQIVGCVTASPNLFHVLGVEPILGRGFTESDARKGAARVVLLSYSAWQSFFAGDPDAIGKQLRLGGEPSIVIGVLPAGLKFPHIALAPKIPFAETASGAQLFQPLIPSDLDLKADMGNFNYRAIARLTPGATLAQASAELNALQESYSLSAHLPFRFGIALTPLAQDVASGVSGALWLLFAAVAAVLLIACVNLASLQLARAVNAERQTAVCAALGAGRLQLLQSRLAESLLLALAGGAAGAALAFAGVRLFLAFVPASVPRIDEVRVNIPVLLFAAGISILSAFAFGALPALRSLRVHPVSALHSIRIANTRHALAARNLMVSIQVACTIVLLIVTSLALRSFSHLMRQARGFETSHVTLAQVDLFAPQYGDNRGDAAKALRSQVIDRLLSALGQLPGVRSAAVTSVAPLTGETWVDNLFRPDHPVTPGKEPAVNVRWIDPAYLPTLHIPLLAGRNLAPSDRAAPAVALISERTARDGFPGENPIGHVIVNLIPGDSRPIRIVGIVADGRINGLKDDARMVYLPYWAYPPYTLSFLVRSSRPSDAIAPDIRRAIWHADPQLAIPALKSMDDQVSDSVATDRFQATLLASFGIAALLLALLGIYGVLAYSVSLRTQEFGVRIALGSGKRALVRLVLYQAARPVFFGTFAGLLAAAVLLRSLRSLFYRPPSFDSLAIGASVVLLLLAATLAAILPARRAASVDPIRALRID
ncbi:MAG: ABC transporter permease [Acidobacteriaceae bacterium]|nr:ABC transporter permease [Acidobacteriaceae bacterium]